MSASAFPSLLFEHWQILWPVSATATASLAAYMAAATSARHWPVKRTIGFTVGVGMIAVALESGVGSFDDRLLSAHMVQHLLLLELAPALLLYGRPVHLALRVLPTREQRALGIGLVALRRRATAPVCLGVFTLVVLGTHLPALFDATLRDQALHDGEHIAYLIAGTLLWWPLIGDPTPRHRIGSIGQLGYVTVAMLPMTLIGAFLTRDPTVFYPGYIGPARALGISPVFDQQQAGAIMWVAGTALMALLGLVVIAAGMLSAERRQRALELKEIVR